MSWLFTCSFEFQILRECARNCLVAVVFLSPGTLLIGKFRASANATSTLFADPHSHSLMATAGKIKQTQNSEQSSPSPKVLCQNTDADGFLISYTGSYQCKASLSSECIRQIMTSKGMTKPNLLFDQGGIDYAQCGTICKHWYVCTLHREDGHEKRRGAMLHFA